MTNFEKFTTQFNQDYPSIYEFDESVMDSPDAQVPYNGRLESNRDNEQYDSYGNDDTSLERIYYFGDFDIYIKFSGTRQSYSGMEWTGFSEVKPVTKTITEFE